MDFEQELGITKYRGDVVLNANLWDNNGELHQFSVETTKRMIKKNISSRQRFSIENTIDICSKKGKCHTTKKVAALLYRARRSLEKNLAIGDKTACHLGVLQS